MNFFKTGRNAFIVSLVAAALALSGGLCSAKENDENRPARSIAMAAEYPGVEVPPDENVSMDIIFHNQGKSDENMGGNTVAKPPV